MRSAPSWMRGFRRRGELSKSGSLSSWRRSSSLSLSVSACVPLQWRISERLAEVLPPPSPPLQFPLFPEQVSIYDPIAPLDPFHCINLCNVFFVSFVGLSSSSSHALILGFLFLAIFSVGRDAEQSRAEQSRPVLE
ncbi:hypothetical protein CDL15_Pgr004604 [Punica granatum]|uniref:Uncharacterized protein n=1 Tax=Punica granatum TaxID=22663 RepID=A0A218WPP5_PUNGR|nr:hypothetical protein CDL15_Pgr004604 [Punica granatum]